MARAVWVDSEGNRYHRHFDFSVTTCRDTGDKVWIGPSAHDDELKPWTAECLKHGQPMFFATLQQAKHHSRVVDWCGGCAHDRGWHDGHEQDLCLNYEGEVACFEEVIDTSDVEVGTFYRFELVEVV